MKILLLNNLYPPTVVGGAERSVEVLARGLAEHGLDVAVACLAQDEDRTEIRDGVTVHRFAHGNVYWPFSSEPRNAIRRLRWHAGDALRFAGQARLENLLDQFRPDVVHTNNLVGFGSNIIPMVKRRGLPVVHTLRDFGLICSRSSLFKKQEDCETRCASCKVLTARKASAALQADLVVGNSAFMIERHRHFGIFCDTPARTIYNAVPGILGERDAPVSRNKNDLLQVGFAGAIKPEKGIETLLDALQAIGPHGWRLSIAGKGDKAYVARLQKRYGELPIDWLGFVPIRPFLDGLDLMVIPSIWPEPMPRTLIEAMAHRLPVFVSDAGGSPEVAAMYDGAKLYPKRETGALARLLAETIATPPPRTRPDPEVLRTFSVEQLVDNYLAAYQEAIASNQSKAKA